MNRIKLLLPVSTLMILVVGMFVVKSANSLDPDFGLHIRMGQEILSSGIAKTDTFSYTMPGFSFVNHEWLSDVIIAKLFPLIGFPGLSVIFSLLTVASMGIMFSVKKVEPNLSSFTLFLFLTIAFLNFVTVRPLVVSWFLFSFLLWIVWTKDRLEKWRYTIPIIFLAWANLHGGWPVGLGLYGLFVFVRMAVQKRLLITDLIILLVSFLVTLINPYGINLWREIWLVISSTDTRTNISEWQPSIVFFEPSAITLILIAGSLLLKFWRQLPAEKGLLFFLFLLYGLTAVRNFPFLIIVSVPMAFEGLNCFIRDIKTIKFGMARFYKAAVFFLLLGFLFLTINVYGFLKDGFRSDITGIGYPVKAVDFLNRHQPSGQLFSRYEWGGYLVWKLPGKKDFIDGRMPHWQQDGYSAFREYLKILKGEQNFQPVFDKYQIDTVLWPVAQKQTNQSDWDKFFEKMNSFFKIKETNKDLGQRLLEAGWVVIYKDLTAEVFFKGSN